MASTFKACIDYDERVWTGTSWMSDKILVEAEGELVSVQPVVKSNPHPDEGLWFEDQEDWRGRCLPVPAEHRLKVAAFIFSLGETSLVRRFAEGRWEVGTVPSNPEIPGQEPVTGTRAVVRKDWHQGDINHPGVKHHLTIDLEWLRDGVPAVKMGQCHLYSDKLETTHLIWPRHLMVEKFDWEEELRVVRFVDRSRQ